MSAVEKQDGGGEDGRGEEEKQKLGCSPPLAGSHIDDRREIKDKNESVSELSDTDTMDTTEDNEILERTILPKSPKKKISKKRKVEAELEISPGKPGNSVKKDDNTTKFLSAVEKLCREVSLMSLLIEKNVNTKIEIKEKARAMKKLATNIERRKNTLVFYEDEIDGNEVGKELEEKNEKEEKKKDEGKIEDKTEPTEPIICERCRTIVKKEELEIDEIRGSLQRVAELTVEERRTLSNRNWPECLFQNTKVVRGNPFMGSKDINGVILVMGKNDESRLIDTAIARFPEIKMLVEEEEDKEEENDCQMDTGMEKENYKMMENTVKIGKKTQTRKIFIIKSDDGIEAVDTIHKIIDEHKIDGTDMGVVATEKHDRSTLRKRIEMKLRISKHEIDFYVPTKYGNSSIRPTPKKETVTSLNVILKSENKDRYDETLRELKKEINSEMANKLGVEIKGVVKTDTGDMKIMLEEIKQGSVKELQSKVQRITETVADLVSIKTNEVWKGAKRRGALKSLFLQDLDTVVTKEELEENLKAVPELKNAQWMVAGLRPSLRGRGQTAKIEVEAEVADVLIRNEHIKLGWCSAKVVECVNPLRCYKCLKLGHKAKECTASEAGYDRCYNCNQTGHQARNCQKTAICRDCNEEGHRSGTMNCNVFRRLVNETRRENKKKLMSELF